MQTVQTVQTVWGYCCRGPHRPFLSLPSFRYLVASATSNMLTEMEAEAGMHLTWRYLSSLNTLSSTSVVCEEASRSFSVWMRPTSVAYASWAACRGGGRAAGELEPTGAGAGSAKMHFETGRCTKGCISQAAMYAQSASRQHSKPMFPRLPHHPPVTLPASPINPDPTLSTLVSLSLVAIFTEAPITTSSTKESA